MAAQGRSCRARVGVQTAGKVTRISWVVCCGCFKAFGTGFPPASFIWGSEFSPAHEQKSATNGKLLVPPNQMFGNVDANMKDPDDVLLCIFYFSNLLSFTEICC